MIDGEPLVGAGKRVIRIANDRITCAFGLHVALAPFAQNNETLAGILSRTPDPIALVISNGLGKAVFGPKEVDRTAVAIIVREDSGLPLFFRGEGVIVSRHNAVQSHPSQTYRHKVAEARLASGARTSAARCPFYVRRRGRQER